MDAKTAFPNAETGTAGRFRSAWDAFQFAAEWLGRARKHYYLAELVGDADRVAHIAAEIALAEKAVAATEAEWRKTGPAQ